MTRDPMGFFTKVGQLFTGSAQSNASKKSTKGYPSEAYKGFTITPQPLADNGQFRVAALIEKQGETEEELKQHKFIRSDTVANADQAAELAVSKCKIFIDQMGDNIFN